MSETLSKDVTEILSIEEIERRYDGVWVFIVEPQYGPGDKLIGGRVLYHDADRDEFDRCILDNPVLPAAIRYVGEWPEDMDYVL